MRILLVLKSIEVLKPILLILCDQQRKEEQSRLPRLENLNPSGRITPKTQKVRLIVFLSEVGLKVKCIKFLHLDWMCLVSQNVESSQIDESWKTGTADLKEQGYIALL